jgi:hypothetical protein
LQIKWDFGAGGGESAGHLGNPSIHYHSITNYEVFQHEIATQLLPFLQPMNQSFSSQPCSQKNSMFIAPLT